MPVGDGVFAHLPAQQDHAAFDFAGKIKQADIEVFDLNTNRVDFGESVFGALFGFARLSHILKMVESDIKGRLVVFFPGHLERSNYRLLDARDGWNYMAVPITLHGDGGVQ